MRIPVRAALQAETHEVHDDPLADLTPEADIDTVTHAPAAVANQQAATHNHVANVVGTPANVVQQPHTGQPGPAAQPAPIVQPAAMAHPPIATLHAPTPAPPPQPVAAAQTVPPHAPPIQPAAPAQNLATPQVAPQAPQPITITPVAPAAINVQPVAPVLAAAVPAAAALAAAPTQAPDAHTPPEANVAPSGSSDTGKKGKSEKKESSSGNGGGIRGFFRRLRGKPLRKTLYVGTLGIGYLCHKSYQKFYGTKLKFWDWLKGGKQMDEVKEKKGGITKKVGAWFKDWRRVLLAAEVVFVPWSIPLVALAGLASFPSLAIMGGKGVDLALNGTKHEWFGWLRRGSKKAEEKPKDK